MSKAMIAVLVLAALLVSAASAVYLVGEYNEYAYRRDEGNSRSIRQAQDELQMGTVLEPDMVDSDLHQRLTKCEEPRHLDLKTCDAVNPTNACAWTAKCFVEAMRLPPQPIAARMQTAAEPHDQHDPVEGRRAAYTAKIDAWLTRQWGGGAQYSGDALTLVEGGANVRDETALACVVAQLQVPPPPYFRRIRIAKVNLETRTLVERISSSLPINRPIPTSCELPPPGFFD